MIEIKGPSRAWVVLRGSELESRDRLYAQTIQLIGCDMHEVTRRGESVLNKIRDYLKQIESSRYGESSILYWRQPPEVDAVSTEEGFQAMPPQFRFYCRLATVPELPEGLIPLPEEVREAVTQEV